MGCVNAIGVKTVTYSDGRTLERTFTPRGQVEGLTFGGTQVATLARDPGGRRIGTAFANGLTDTRSYRADNRLAGTSVAPTAGGEAQLALGYSYDANKRKTAETDGRKPAQSQSFGYDAQDRMTDWRLSDVADPDGSHQTWTVSPVGDLKETSRDGLPEMRSHTQVHEITAINGQALTHDAAGNLTVSEKGQRFVWDAENRLIEATSAPNKDGVHGTVRYLTDALGRRVARTARGSTTLYVYDGAQVVQEITVPHILPPSAKDDDGSLANLATVPDGAILMPTWDADGNRHDVTRINFQPERTEIPAGFIADKGKDYALRSNTLTYGWTAPEGTPSRDPALIRRFHPMPQYDTAAPMGAGGWAWQIALPSGSYPVIVVMGDATSRHHTNNVVVQGQAQTDPDPYDAAETQSYLKGDFDGYAVQATVTDGVLKIEAGADAVLPVICFVEIGPEGMQLTDEMKKRLADEVEAATQRTGGKPYGKGNEIEVKSLVYSGDYIDEPLMVETKSGRFYVHANAQFSPMAISNAAGEVVERRQYGPYGEIEVNEEGVPPVELSVGYTGREWDADVGMYYFRARWYSPKMGRFVNRDPAGYVNGLGLYGAYFVPDAVDPMGLWAEWHHLLPQAIFDDAFLTKHGLKGALDIHDKKFGLMMDDALHAGKGGIHPNWNKNWSDWIKLQESCGYKLSVTDIEERLWKMRWNPKFQPFFATATRAPVTFNQWKKAEEALKRKLAWQIERKIAARGGRAAVVAAAQRAVAKEMAARVASFAVKKIPFVLAVTVAAGLAGGESAEDLLRDQVMANEVEAAAVAGSQWMGQAIENTIGGPVKDYVANIERLNAEFDAIMSGE